MSFDFTQFLFFILWGLVVILFLAWFFYLYLKRKLITVLSTTALMQMFIPLILMYPFAFSEKNIMSTGRMSYYMYLNEINRVFIISLIGIVFFFIGSYVAMKIKTDHPIMNNLSNAYISLLSIRNLTLFLFCLLLIFLWMFKLGFFENFFGGRSFSMENSSLRPIANFFYSSVTFFLMLTLTKYYQRKTKLLLIYVIVALFLSLTAGTRGAVLNSILMFVFMYFNINNKNASKVNLFKISIVGLLLLTAAMYLGEARQGEYHFITAMINSWDKVFYGNNFSDLRDFAWVMAYWDGEFLYGKTIFSGLLAFVPSSLLHLRSEWGLGIFTVSTIGYDTSVHPGLRPGIFGESFFNFGIPGVCVFGFIYGCAINLISRYVQDIIENSSSRKEIIYKTSLGYLISGLAFNFMITAGFFGVYVKVLILFFGFVAYSFKRKFIVNKGSA